MSKMTHQGMLVFFIVLGAALLYLLSSVLTPFLFGALLAYLFNPVVKRFEKFGLPHLPSVIVVFICLIIMILLFMLMLIPLIEKQIAMMASIYPQIISWLDARLSPWIDEYLNIETLKSSLSFTLSKSGWVLGAVLHSSHTFIILLVDAILIPIVTFYFLRDWDVILNNIKNIIPKDDRQVWIKMATSCDVVLGAFFKGQMMVMIFLAFIYGIGLSLIGLQVGFIIGFIGGILSIVPYLGSIFVLLIASLTSLVQFGSTAPLVWVLCVFIVGQTFEGYVLTPYFVGGRIGLHPVFVIFAVMSGGVLFGTVGILLALPASAVIKVLLGYARRRYMPV